MTVDDQPLFLQVARRLIDVTPGFESVAEATSGLEALDKAGGTEPDLVLLDVRMPGLDGIETARRFRARHPEALVVLISADALEEVEPLARSCGAGALVRKEELDPRLLRRIWDAHVAGRSSAAHREGP